MKGWVRSRTGGISPSRSLTPPDAPSPWYSRYGSGESDLLGEERPVSYMHDEAQRALRLDLLRQLDIGGSQFSSVTAMALRSP